MTSTFVVGTKVRFTATFRSLAGALAAPTSVTGKYMDPTGATTTNPTIVNPSTGVYYFDVTLASEGTWWFQLAGTGAVVAAIEMYCKAETGFS